MVSKRVFKFICDRILAEAPPLVDELGDYGSIISVVPDAERDAFMQYVVDLAKVKATQGMSDEALMKLLSETIHQALTAMGYEA